MVLNVPLVVTNVLIVPYFALMVLVVSVDGTVRVLKIPLIPVAVLVIRVELFVIELKVARVLAMELV